MSDDELRKIINRMDMEKKYAQLTAPQQSKGKKIVSEILGKAAMNTAQKYANQVMDKAVDAMIKKATKKKGS